MSESLQFLVYFIVAAVLVAVMAAWLGFVTHGIAYTFDAGWRLLS